VTVLACLRRRARIPISLEASSRGTAVTGFLALVIVLIAPVRTGSASMRGEGPDEIVSDMVLVRGTIEIVNHPSLGRTPASNQWIFFRRTDCKQCVVGVKADLDGKYQVYLWRGKYKIVCADERGGGEPPVDLLARDQPRFFEASKVDSPLDLNIKLAVPGVPE